MQLMELISEVEHALSDEERASDLAFEESRKIIRKTKKAIHGLHLGQRDPELIDSISSDIAGLVEALAGYPRLVFGADVSSAMMEFAETVLYDYSLQGKELPSYSDLEITPAAWAMGLADCIGELRRDMLTALINDDLARAEELFATMDELCDALMTFDVKDSVAPLRRKQDIARGIMERSRTDLATAKMMSKVQ